MLDTRYKRLLFHLMQFYSEHPIRLHELLGINLLSTLVSVNYDSTYDKTIDNES